MQVVEAGGHSADSKRSGEYGYSKGIVGVLLLSLVTRPANRFAVMLDAPATARPTISLLAILMMHLRFERHNSHARSRLQITNPRDSRSAVSGVYRRVELPPTRQEQSYPPSMQMVEAGGHSADSKRSGEYGYGRGSCWRAASVARRC